MFKQFLDIIPEYDLLPKDHIRLDSPCGGIKAVQYRGAPYQGKETNVFAYIGFPDDQAAPVPAVILVHGGGGHAYAEWVNLWNQHGFAAIAMDLRGFRPIPGGKTLSDHDPARSHDSYYEKMPSDSLTTASPDGYCIYDPHTPVSETWFYQAIVNVILAHNLIRQDPAIDIDRIGIVGISWGANIVSQVIAHDPRFSFAVPIYGSANLHFSLTHVCAPFHNPQACSLWNAHKQYDHVTCPVLWICWNKDHAFDIYPNSLCYLQTRHAGSILSILSDTDHSHYHGWCMDEPYQFAKSIIFQDKPLLRPLTEPIDFPEITFTVDSNDDYSATLYYITEPMRYTKDSKPDYQWQTKPCHIKGNTVSVCIPENARGYYVALEQVIQNKIYTSATAYRLLPNTTGKE